MNLTQLINQTDTGTYVSPETTLLDYIYKQCTLIKFTLCEDPECKTEFASTNNFTRLADYSDTNASAMIR
jgi:hypothetical protein